MEESETHRRHLAAAIAEVKALLRRRTGVVTAGEETPPPAAAPSALERLTAAFGLSPFERGVLLLCAGRETDPAFAGLLAAAHGDPRCDRPTFALALELLDEPEWNAVSPAGALRHWRLIETEGGEGSPLASLRLGERVLHYLLGIEHLDERLAGWVEPLPLPEELAPSHRVLAERLAGLWRQAGGYDTAPVVHLTGSEPAELFAVAAAGCVEMGLGLHSLAGSHLPAAAAELEGLRRLWEREAVLAGSALLLDLTELDPGDGARQRAAAWLAEHTWGGVIVAGPARPEGRRRQVVPLEVPRPTAAEQQELWRRLLPAGEGLEELAAELAGRFRLGTAAVRAAAAEALAAAGAEAEDSGALAGALWEACRRRSRPRLDGLARRLETAAGWDDLVLPGEVTGLLRRLASQVRHRRRVHESWGFAGGERGLGTTALFAGPSGTGKTLAAEVLAHDLGLDLYQVDLSAVVSKYIGETEKNLARLFDAAEQGSTVLLFDEADALFGKRTEIKDSHDRWANLEVSYLLQRMESYSGLAILTTNLKSNLDSAFVRRLGFIIRFPFPDAADRLALWQRMLPASLPRRELDLSALARLNISGAHIRNIALTAAYAAAAAGRPLSMGDLVAAAQVEYVKLEKTMPDLGRAF